MNLQTVLFNESEVKNRLLQTTEQLVYQHGIAATGIDAIVKASGVARKTIYRYFANKDELVAAALIQRDERWMQWFIQHTTNDHDPMQRIGLIFDTLQ